MESCKCHSNVQKGMQGWPRQNRPISHTCMHCKVMESVIRDAMVDFLLTNNLMCKSQHGFLPGCSTLTNLLEHLETDWWGASSWCSISRFQESLWCCSNKPSSHNNGKYLDKGESLELGWCMVDRKIFISCSKWQRIWDRRCQFWCCTGEYTGNDTFPHIQQRYQICCKCRRVTTGVSEIYTEHVCRRRKMGKMSQQRWRS